MQTSAWSLQQENSLGNIRRDLNVIFKRHADLVEDGVIQGCYQLDYDDIQKKILITLKATDQPEDPSFKQRVKPRIKRFTKHLVKHYQQSGITCEVTLAYAPRDDIKLTAEAANQLKQAVLSFKRYEGTFELENFDARVQLAECFDQLVGQHDLQVIGSIRKEARLYLMRCLIPCLPALVRKYTKLGKTGGLLDILINHRELAFDLSAKHIKLWIALRDHQLRRPLACLENRKPNQVLFEYLFDDVIQFMQVRQSFLAELAQWPFNRHSLHQATQLMEYLRELTALLQPIYTLADEVYEHVQLYEAAIYNCKILFESGQSEQLYRAMGVEFSNEYKIFQQKGYATPGNTGNYYRRYKDHYAVLQQQLQALNGELKQFQAAATKHRSLSMAYLRQLRRPQWQPLESPVTVVCAPDYQHAQFYGPRNQSATKESKGHATLLAQQLKRRQQLLAEQDCAPVASALPSTPQVLVEVLGHGQLRFDMTTGCDDQDTLVAIRVAPLLEHPLFVLLVGLLPLTIQENKALRDQQGRDLLTKVGVGANGLKCFGEHLLGLKLFKDAGRLLLVGLPLPEGEGWCYVPTQRLAHEEWEALQVDCASNRSRWQLMRNDAVSKVKLTLLTPNKPSAQLLKL